MASLKTIHQRKETLKTILTLVAAALGVIQTPARAAEEPAWSIDAKMISRTVAASAVPASSANRPLMGNANTWRCGKSTRDDTVT